MILNNDIIRISEELDVPLKKLYMLSNNRIRYHKRNQKKCYSNYRKVIIHRGRGIKQGVKSAERISQARSKKDT